MRPNRPSNGRRFFCPPDGSALFASRMVLRDRPPFLAHALLLLGIQKHFRGRARPAECAFCIPDAFTGRRDFGNMETSPRPMGQNRPTMTAAFSVLPTGVGRLLLGTVCVQGPRTKRPRQFLRSLVARL